MPKRKSTTIEHPVFGTIKLNQDGYWSGLVHLPLFAQYDDKSNDDVLDVDDEVEEEHSRRTRQQKRQAERFAAGLFPVHVSDAEGERPTPAQVEAYRFLVDHESQVVDAIMAHVFHTYENKDAYWTLDGLQRQDDGFELSGPGDLKQLMRLSTVLIEQTGGDRADVIFYFNSILDEEHGVEVITNGTDIEEELPDVFPFDLPSGVNATEIAPEPGGHRLVEFKQDGKWCGIYVLDEELRCAGIVASSVTPRSYRYQLNRTDQIEDLRAATHWRRWFASPARSRTLGWLTASNWFVSLPCLLVAWAYLTPLFWASIVLSVICFVGRWLLEDSWHWLPVIQVVASIAGLVYAANSADFGSQEHVSQVVSVYASIVWWCVAAIDTLAIILLVILVAGFHRNLIRSGLGAVFPALLMVVVLTSGLVGARNGHFSSFQLLWLTPLAIVLSIALLLVGVLTNIFDFAKRCPVCRQTLRSPNARQCLKCGADWH